MKKTQRGFTLIEMLVVVVIVGILATLVAANVIDRLQWAKVRLTVAGIARLKGEVQLFKLDQDRYPAEPQDLVHPPAYVDPQKWPDPGYLDQVPNDGWDRPFQYSCPGVRGPYDIVSWGADGKPGGEGVNADLWSHPPR